MLRRVVSIPFIAGQWSLLQVCWSMPGVGMDVSIPFIAGQWSLHGIFIICRGFYVVSIPFIAGQWSLPHME